MDLSKAFHTLYHNLWLTKLNEYGFSISVIKFLYIYFSEQLKRLNINNNFNEWCKYSWENHRVISRSLFIQHFPWWHFLFYTRSSYKTIQSHTMSIIKKSWSKVKWLYQSRTVYGSFKQKGYIFNFFLKGKFNYSPLFWKFSTTAVNHKTNWLHERALRG